MTNRRAIRIALIIVLAIVGLVAGLSLLDRVLDKQEHVAPPVDRGAEVWTCSMHPQVRMPKPGKCPICSMPLVRAASPSAGAGDVASVTRLELSAHARAMAGVETLPVGRRRLTHEVSAVGRVQYNEAALATITARVDGYIERLFVDFTGVEVKKGDHLVEIYSPDLIVAQQELLIALSGHQDPSLIESTKLKLLRWDLTDSQVQSLVERREISDRITLYSPIRGTVVEKLVVQKSAVKAGDVLYRLADLESVWVYLDIYEYELPWIRYGQQVDISAEAHPGRKFAGRVWFISPMVTEASRSVKVLVNMANEDRSLKPGMYVSARVQAALSPEGRAAPTGVEGLFACPMHPDAVQPQAGSCPACGMDLERIPGAPQQTAEGELLSLAVPVSAVLDSGTRRLVFVERTPGEFVPVEVTLGARAAGYYAVLAGLQEGDRVAVRGGFLLDSQLQIAGLPSLFYREGQAGAAPHLHEGHAPSAGDTLTDPEPHEESPRKHEH